MYVYGVYIGLYIVHVYISMYCIKKLIIILYDNLQGIGISEYLI